MKNSLAWKDGSWLPTEQATLAIDDLGFLQGVVIVDRLRTVAGVALDTELHLRRFQNGCDAVGIELPSQAELHTLLDECVLRNREVYKAHDFSVVLLATPGRVHHAPTRSTVIVQPLDIPWRRLAYWYSQGQPLVTSNRLAVPAECWLPSIKTRARIQYYLADREAVERTGNPHAAGVLHGGTDSSLTETSAANLLVVEGNRIVSPPKDLILPGISLDRTLRVAEAAGFDIVFDELSSDRAKQSDVILLCGSTGGIWAASQLDERIFHQSTTHPAYCQISDGWKRELGIDIISQAMSAADRNA